MASTSGVAEAATKSLLMSIRRSLIHCSSMYVNRMISREPDQSMRNASVGAKLVTPRAGTYEAMSAADARMQIAVANTSGSVGLTPKRITLTTRATHQAIATPN